MGFYTIKVNMFKDEDTWKWGVYRWNIQTNFKFIKKIPQCTIHTQKYFTVKLLLSHFLDKPQGSNCMTAYICVSPSHHPLWSLRLWSLRGLIKTQSCKVKCPSQQFLHVQGLGLSQVRKQDARPSVFIKGFYNKWLTINHFDFFFWFEKVLR